MKHHKEISYDKSMQQKAYNQIRKSKTKIKKQNVSLIPFFYLEKFAFTFNDWTASNIPEVQFVWFILCNM